MQNLINQLLRDKKLTEAEKDTLQRFSQDDKSRLFLQVYEILKDYNFADEAVETLTIGLQNHPQFTPARVALAKELFSRKIYSEALRILLEANDSFQNNYQAHFLCVNLGIILDRDEIVKKHIVFIRPESNAQAQKLISVYENEGIDSARRFLGIEDQQEIALPKPGTLKKPTTIADFTDVDYRDAKFDRLLHFHITSLDEVFHGEKNSHNQHAGAPLESTTIAELYLKQQHYGKALEIYRNLLIKNPRSENYRHKVIELQQLQKEKRNSDLVLDPQTFQKIEAVEIIQRQINYVESILAKIL